MDRRIKKSGFTIIELVVVIFIIGLLATISIPNFRKRRPSYERKQFVSHINALVQTAWQEAIEKFKLRVVAFNEKTRQVSIGEMPIDPKNPTKKDFKPLKFKYLKTNYTWPENLVIKNFFVNGKDELVRSDKREIYIFINPEGFTDDAIINILDTSDLTIDGKEKQLSLVLNPFKIQFKKYDSFQKP